MKFLVLALALAPLSACRTRPADRHEPVQPLPAAETAAPSVDLSSLQARSMTVEEFLKACQELSGFNFTYSESTKGAMSSASVRVDGPDRVPVGQFGNFLAAQLQRCGFTCERVGPEHLRVFLVQLRPS